MPALPWWGSILLSIALKYGPEWLIKLIPSLPKWLQKLIGNPETIINIIKDFLDALDKQETKIGRKAIRATKAEKCRRSGGVACETDVKRT